MDNIYLGNPNLKKANVAQEFTQEQVLEFYACRNDPTYFAEKYVKIVSLDEGLTPFKPYHFQKLQVLNHFLLKYLLIFQCQPVYTEHYHQY